MGLWNISQCVSYDVEENASGGKSGLYQRIYGDGSGRRTDYCDYPAAVSEVESVGSISNADIEKILSLEPDLVLASTHFSDDAVKQLEDAGVPVLYLYDEGDKIGRASCRERV